ncbi:tetratricopeptide repeat protein [Roseovarius mucosus]|uniref:tetratricopeptide repeat protein n=1 Tax=Roseovarius mucosus TaxID=215743 RepID=UPI0035CF09E3
MTKCDRDDHSGTFAQTLRSLAFQLEGQTGDQGWLAALRFGVAGGLAEAGETHLAEFLFRQIVDANPHHLWAWVGLVEMTLARGEADAAADIGHKALATLANEPILYRKTAEALDLAQRHVEAIGIMTSRTIEALDDLAFVISLHRKAAKLEDATSFCERLLALRPDHDLAHLARIEIALQSGDNAGAVSFANEALMHHSDHPEIVLRAAQACRGAGDYQRAMRLVEGASEDTQFAPWFLQLRANLAEDQGAVEDARLLWSRLKSLNLSAFDVLADEAIARLDAVHATQTKDAQGLVAPICEEERHLGLAAPEFDIDRFMLQLDAPRAQNGLSDDDVLQIVAGSDDIPWYRALQIVRHIWLNRSSDLAERLSKSFASRSWPITDLHAFAIEDQLLRNGPRAALDWVRSHPVARREFEAAERLGRVLVSGGSGKLAVRYLWACCRRWPADPQFLRLATQALIVTGAAHRVADLLEKVCPGVDEDWRLACYVSAGLSLGEIGETLMACETQAASGAARAPVVDMIEMSLLVSDLNTAEGYVAKLSKDAGRLEEALISRPRATRVGTLLNEARILAASGWDEGDLGSNMSAIADFFLPARAKVAKQALDVEPPQDVCIPKVPDLIHAIWFDIPETSSEREQLLDAWRQVSRRQVVLHDIRNAQSWLRKNAGSDAARAFAKAPDREQKADLLMLGVLLVEGGLTLSATQWPSRDVDPLIDHTEEAGFFIDGRGAVVTDLLMATPGHSVIETAFEKAVASCLDREKDHRWFKTGPGLLTRALALHLCDEDSEARVTLRALSTVRRLVHPYRPAICPKIDSGAQYP